MLEQTIIGKTPKETIESVKDRIAYTVISAFTNKEYGFIEYLDNNCYKLTDRLFEIKNNPYPIIGELITHNLGICTNSRTEI